MNVNKHENCKVMFYEKVFIFQETDSCRITEMKLKGNHSQQA